MSGEYLGISGLGITTLPYINSPETAFGVVSHFKKLGNKLALEVYPYHTPEWIEQGFGKEIELLGEKYPVPARVNALDIRSWKFDHYNARVTQLHLPFAFDRPQALAQAFLPGINSPARNRDHIGHLIAFGWVTDGYSQEIIRAINDPELVVNIHEDVVRRAIKKGQFQSYLAGLGRLSIEDHTDPPKTVKELVEPLKTNFTLGLDHTDHLESVGLSVEKVLKDEGVRRYTTAIHLAGLQHGKLSSHDLVTQGILEQIGRTPFARSVTVYLDMAPSVVDGMSFNQQIDFWQTQFNLVKSTQPQLAA